MSEGINDTDLKMSPPESGVKVRMYRPLGLGDCFLLAFRTNNGEGRYILIDCGVFVGTSGGKDRMRAIAKDIKAATNGSLYALVATHEHWDHLSGFQFAKKTFDNLEIDEAWMAWTEDPVHPLAKRLRDNRDKALRALIVATTQLTEMGVSEANKIKEVLNFYGDTDTPLGISTTAGQMKYVNERTSSPRYLSPGQKPITLDEVDGIKIYILGPPEEEELLSHSEPSKVDSEVYESQPALTEAMAFYATALAMDQSSDPSRDDKDDDEDLVRRVRPFDKSQRICFEDAVSHREFGKFFRQHYGFTPGEKGDGPAWRRIDYDWLTAAESLALKLDNDTNNTSLAMAIELGKSGKVLLFPGDAQVGNWLSWHDVTWTSEEDDGDKEVTGADLIRRTVLYKVGHHGSHNATLREKGLEMMQSSELTAMIPVDETQAEKKEWLMPFSPLLTRLHEKTRGRVLRADKDLPERPEFVTEGEWDNFIDRIEIDRGPEKLWIEYTISDE